MKYTFFQNSISINKKKANLSLLTLQNDIIWWGTVIFILLIAFYLRLRGFTDRPLWFDESIEYWMAVVPFNQVPQAVATATHDPPFYSLFLHVWLNGGINEFWLRLPSLIASLLSVVGVIYLGRFLSGRLAAIFAGFLLTIIASDVRYAQEVGQYSLMVCLTTWNLIFLYKAAKADRWLWWGLWGLTAVINIYSHYGAAIIILFTATTTVIYHLWSRHWQPIIKQLTVGLVCVLSLFPLVVYIIPQQLGRLGATTQPFAISQLLQTSWRILVFYVTSNPGIMDWPWPSIPQWFVSISLIIAIIIALIHVRWPLEPPIMLLIAWLGYYLISRTGSYFFAPTRHSLLLTPLLTLSIALGITIAYNWQKLAGILLILPILLFALWIPREPAENLRLIAQFWETNRQTEDITYVYYGASPGFGYQLDQINNTKSELPIFWYGRCFQGKQDDFCRGENGIYYSRWTRNFPPEDQRAAFDEIVGYLPTRLWIILSHVHEQDRELLLKGLTQDYAIIDELSVNNEAALLLEKR